MLVSIFLYKLSATLEDIFVYVGYFGVVILNILYRKKYNLKLWQALVYTLVGYIFVSFTGYLMSWVESGFKIWGGAAFVRLVVFVPIIAYPVGKLAKMDWKTACDYVAPSLYIQQAFGHISCIWRGCCCGYPTKYGIYNSLHNDYRFPIQIIESAIAFIIVFLTIRYAKKRGYNSDGTVLPYSMILFGYSRFICEFFRDNIKLFLGISSLAIWALGTGIVGTIWIIIHHRRIKKPLGMTVART